MKPEHLIHRYLLGNISEAEAKQLDRLLAEDPDLRREFVLAAATDTGLREIAFEHAVEPEHPKAESTGASWYVPALWLAVAAAVVAMFTLGPSLFRQDAVASLTSSENAAWESSLPTLPGSQLTPGLLKLKTGVATIRFHSGAEVVMEAPAELQLVTPMKGRLLAGAAVIDVPEAAIGFIIETPDGFAVDYGTQFAVRVDLQSKHSDFEIIKGEIAVHHPESGHEVRLTGQGKTATISQQSLVVTSDESQDDSVPQSAAVIRVGTGGRTTSVIRNDKRKRFLNPEVLTVKRTEREKWDQRSFFAFDLSSVNLDQVVTARLRLNLLPSTLGFASRLPEVNRFAIYGLTNRTKADWQIESLWAESPGPEDGVLLGTFEIPRSQRRGIFGIQNEKFLGFLKDHRDAPVTLILVRETTQIEGVGPGLTHTFASDSHPESVGPTLEFSEHAK